MTSRNSGQTILIVDDEPELRSLIAEGLGLHGYSCETAENGNDALKKFEADAQSFGMILSDITMPGMNGLDLVRAIRERGSQIPIFLVTGHVLATETLPSDLKVTALIEKPLDLGDLAARIKQALTRQNK